MACARAGRRPSKAAALMPRIFFVLHPVALAVSKEENHGSFRLSSNIRRFGSTNTPVRNTEPRAGQGTTAILRQTQRSMAHSGAGSMRCELPS
jgi:hypothetical protein